MAMDPVWEYAKKIKPSKFRCQFCKGIFHGCAKRVKMHLAQVQGRYIKHCPDVPPEIRDKCLHYLLENGSGSCSRQVNIVETEAEEMDPRRENVTAENEVRLQNESDNRRENVTVENEVRTQNESVDVNVNGENGTLEIRESIYRFLKSNQLPMEIVEEATFMHMFCSITHFGSNGIPTSKDLHDSKGFIIDDDEDDYDWD